MILTTTELRSPVPPPLMDPLAPGVTHWDGPHVDDGAMDRLDASEVVPYTAEHFFGAVWRSEGGYACEVWRHQEYVLTILAPTLNDVIGECVERWGPE
jgi:hypothetical protein